MTTRRFRPPPAPPRGRMGRFGPLRPSAIWGQSRTRERLRTLGCVAVDGFGSVLDYSHDFELSRLGLELRDLCDRLCDGDLLDDLLGELLLCRLDLAGMRGGESLVRRHAAVARARERGVRAALAVREHRCAAPGGLLAVLGPRVRELRFGLGELLLGLDVDLPASESGREAGVQALLADRERKLVVGDDDGRLASLVVDVDLTHASGRQCLRDEARGLRVPRDDVDLLAPELRHDHAHARAARPDARTDRVDALHVRLDRDLRPVPGLACDAADLHQAVRDLGNLELEERADELRIAPRENDLRALRPRAHLRDHGLDAAPLLVALAVDLLG